MAAWPFPFGATTSADVDFEGLAHRALDLAVFQAACPAEDEGAPFVGVGHDLSPFEGLPPLAFSGQTAKMCIDLALA